MREVLKSNNPVELNFAEVLLKDAGIEALVFDDHMSILDGSMVILPRRLMVSDTDLERAQAIIKRGTSGTDERSGRGVSATTTDKFLGGKLMVEQPAKGFRAGLDAVMLAAAVPARSNSEILELGSGVGTASLCLAAFHGGAEIDETLVEISIRNAKANGVGDHVTFAHDDVFELRPALRHGFDHVMCNPPFHGEKGVRPGQRTWRCATNAACATGSTRVSSAPHRATSPPSFAPTVYAR